MNQIVSINSMRFMDASDQLSYGYEITNNDISSSDNPFDVEVIDPAVLLETAIASTDPITQHLLSHIDSDGVKVNNKYYNPQFVKQCRNNMYVCDVS